MNGTLNHDGYEFVLKAAYDVELVAAVKELPGRHWDADGKTWTFPITPEAVSLAASIENGWGISILGNALEALDEFKLRTVGNQMASHQAASDYMLRPGLHGTPFPFQLAGIEYALKNKRVLIGDEMGLGKTIQAIGVMHELQAIQPRSMTIVVCPASLKLMWQRAINQWLPDLNVLIASGTKPIAFEADVVVINYDILYAHLEALKAIKPVLLICDESHFVKDLKAARTKSVLELSAEAKHVLLLSGTPVLNKPIELWSQLMILRQDKAFGNFWTFTKRYCDAHQEERYIRGGGTRMIWNMDGSSNLPELGEKLRSLCMVRRMKADVLKELPPKMPPEIIPVEISNRKKYDKAQNDLVAWLREGKRLSKQFVKSLEGLPEEERQAKIAEYRASSAERARRAMTIVRINELKWITALGKIAAFSEWVNSFLETGQKLVVFGWHRDVVNELHTLFREADVAHAITGETSLENRQAAVDEFQNNPDKKLIFLNTRAGGLGLTLTAASNVAFIELDWTPALLQQAEDRCHRIGQKDAVTPHYFIGRNTIDEWMVDLISGKQRIAAEVLGDVSGDSVIMCLADYLAELEDEHATS